MKRHVNSLNIKVYTVYLIQLRSAQILRGVMPKGSSSNFYLFHLGTWRWTGIKSGLPLLKVDDEVPEPFYPPPLAQRANISNTPAEHPLRAGVWRNESVPPAVGDVIQLSCCCCCSGKEWGSSEGGRAGEGRERRQKGGDSTGDYMTEIRKKHEGGERSVGASGGYVCSWELQLLSFPLAVKCLQLLSRKSRGAFRNAVRLNLSFLFRLYHPSSRGPLDLRAPVIIQQNPLSPGALLHPGKPVFKEISLRG